MSFIDKEPSEHPSASALVEAEQNVHALPFSEAFERAMISNLAIRESHFQFGSNESIRISEEITPPGLRDILYSPSNHLSAVDINLSLLAKTAESDDDTIKLRIALTANNTPYVLQTNHEQATLQYTTSEGRPAAIPKLPQDVIALAASIALATQQSDPLDSIPATRNLGSGRDDYAALEQFLVIAAQNVGELTTTTTSVFEESDQKAIIAKLVETETPETTEVENVLDLDKVDTNRTDFIDAQLRQQITQRPERTERRHGAIHQSQIPPSDYPFLRLYGLSLPDQLTEHAITPKDSATWQQLCYEFMEVIAPCIQGDTWGDDSFYYDN